LKQKDVRHGPSIEGVILPIFDVRNVSTAS
jgi:hypothetical protein